MNKYKILHIPTGLYLVTNNHNQYRLSNERDKLGISSFSSKEKCLTHLRLVSNYFRHEYGRYFDAKWAKRELELHSPEGNISYHWSDFEIIEYEEKHE
jgi:hypothetical protein